MDYWGGGGGGGKGYVGPLSNYWGSGAWPPCPPPPPSSYAYVDPDEVPHYEPPHLDRLFANSTVFSFGAGKKILGHFNIFLMYYSVICFCNFTAGITLSFAFKILLLLFVVPFNNPSSSCKKKKIMALTKLLGRVL